MDKKQVSKIFFTLIIVFALIGMPLVHGVTRTITSSSDNIDTFIRNSNGKYWTASAANLQSAIDDLDNESGWVDGSGASVTGVSTTIKVGDYCTLKNIRIIHGSGANVTAITNYDTSNGNTHITLENIFIDMQGTTCTESYENHPYSHANGVTLRKCDNTTIKGCELNNTVGCAIYLMVCDDSVVRDNTITHAGLTFEGSALLANHVNGVFIDSSENCKILDNHIMDVYSCGITTEMRLGYKRSSHILIDGNTITDAMYGIYVERVSNHTITNNVITDIAKTEAYSSGAASGLRIGASTDVLCVNDTLISDNIISNCGSDSVSCGIYADGYRNTIANNKVYEQTGYGLSLGFGSDNICKGNSFDTTTNSAITGVSYNTVFDGNIISESAVYGIAYSPSTASSNECSVISNNLIMGTDGVRINSHNMVISGNTITDTSDMYPIYLYAGVNISVTGNYIDYAPYDCIYARSGSCDLVISGNILSDATDKGIELAGADRCVISNNHIIGCYTGVGEDSSCDYNVFNGNNLRGCTSAWSLSGNNAVSSGNNPAVT